MVLDRVPVADHQPNANQHGDKPQTDFDRLEGEAEFFAGGGGLLGRRGFGFFLCHGLETPAGLAGQADVRRPTPPASAYLASNLARYLSGSASIFS